MKRFLTLLICGMLTFIANAQVKVVQNNKMPKSIVNFVNANYNDREVLAYQIDFTNYNFNYVDDYEVLYENGTKLEFLKNGSLKSIDCGRLDYVKWHILPEEIAEFIKYYFTQFVVVEYSIDYKFNKPIKYKVKLNNSLELTFNKNYKVIEVD